MQNKNASVLAVMAKDLERLKSAFASAPTEKQRALISEVHGNLSEARAAVAELIAATKQYMAAEMLQDIIAAEARLEAALTHAGEAP